MGVSPDWRPSASGWLLALPARKITRPSQHVKSFMKFVCCFIQLETVNTKSGTIQSMSWTFLTNHALVLLCVARDPQTRLRDIAERVGITERAAHRIVTDLEAAGYLTRHRKGNRNHYEIHPELPFRHPTNEDHAVGEMLKVMLRKPRATPSSAA